MRDEQDRPRVEMVYREESIEELHGEAAPHVVPPGHEGLVAAINHELFPALDNYDCTDPKDIAAVKAALDCLTKALDETKAAVWRTYHRLPK